MDGVQTYDSPLVTIGVPVYNEEEHLAEALDSLLSQDYPEVEVVICDNASTDRTQEICDRYAAADARVCYHRGEENVGGINNFRRALSLARGEFFMWASGHDLWHPSFVSRCLEAFAGDPSVVLAYTRADWVDDEARLLETVWAGVDTRGVTDRPSRLSAAMWGLPFPGLTIYGLMRASALRETRGYTQSYAPDLVLLAELSLVGTFAHVGEVLHRVRKMSSYGSWEATLEKHFPGVTRRGAHKLYWRMFSELFRATRKHCRGRTEPLHAKIIVAHCLLTKYRWILMGLLALRRRRA